MTASVGITDAKIQAMRPPERGQVEISDKVMPGLRVRIGTSGVRTFILRKRIGGRLRNVTLGRYGSRFGLADARRKARDLLVDIEAGRDPTADMAAAKRSGAALGTVAALWRQYIEQAVTGRKRTAPAIERIGRLYILPALGDRVADSVTRADVTRLVESVTFRDVAKPTPREGRSVHQQLSAFYSWAMPKLDKLPANPCRDAGRPPASKARERHLDEKELRAFWRACSCLGWPYGPAFKLLLLTGQRRGEVFDASWSEFADDLWTIPASRVKNGVTHLVPLSRQVLAILAELPSIGGTDKLFPSRSNPERSASGFTKGQARLARKMAEELGVHAVASFTLHDLRRTMATGMQRIGVALPVVEAVLNHVSGSRAGIVGVYQRHAYLKEKRAALSAWALEVDRIACE